MILENTFQEIEEMIEFEEFQDAANAAFELSEELKRILRADLMYDIPVKVTDTSTDILDEINYIKSRKVMEAIEEADRLARYAENCAYDQGIELDSVSVYGTYNNQVRSYYYETR